MKYKFKQEFLDAFTKASKQHLGRAHTANLLNSVTLTEIGHQIDVCLNWRMAQEKNIYPLKGKTWAEVHANPKLVIITKCVNL